MFAAYYYKSEEHNIVYPSHSTVTLVSQNSSVWKRYEN